MEANEGYSGWYGDLKVKVTHAKKSIVVTSRFPKCVLEAKNSELSLAEISFIEPEDIIYEEMLLPVCFEHLIQIINLKVILHKLVIQLTDCECRVKDELESIVQCIRTNTARVQNIDMELQIVRTLYQESEWFGVLEELAMGLSANTTLKHFSLRLVCKTIDDSLINKLAQAAQENETLTSITIVVEMEDFDRITINSSGIDMEILTA